MRGSGNLIKKTDNSMKNYNLQNNIEQYTMNQIINSNSSNDNVKDRKKTCSQDQNKKAKGKFPLYLHVFLINYLNSIFTP